MEMISEYLLMHNLSWASQPGATEWNMFLGRIKSGQALMVYRNHNQRKIMSHNLNLINKSICFKRVVYGHLKQKCLRNCSFPTNLNIEFEQERTLLLSRWNLLPGKD